MKTKEVLVMFACFWLATWRGGSAALTGDHLLGPLCWEKGKKDLGVPRYSSPAWPNCVMACAHPFSRRRVARPAEIFSDVLAREEAALRCARREALDGPG